MLLLRAVATLLGALAMLALGCVLLVAWRLGQGPLDLDWALQRLVASYNKTHTGTPVAVGHAMLEWKGFSHGPSSALTLQLSDVGLGQGSPGNAEAPAAAADTATATLSLAGLLHGEIAPGTVGLGHASIRLVRDDHGVRLDGTPPAPSGTPGTGLPQILSGLARPPGGEASVPASVPGLNGLERLRSLRLDGLDVSLRDEVLGTKARLALGAVDVERAEAGGLQGTAAGTLTVAGVDARLMLDAGLAADGGTRLHLTMAPTDVQALHGLAPALDKLQALQLPLGGEATLVLSPTLNPISAALHLDAGRGGIQVRDKLIRLDRATMDAEAAWSATSGTPPAWTAPARLAVHNATAVVRAPEGPVTVTAGLDATRGPEGIAATIDLAVDRVAFADLPGLWPDGLSKHVRPWLTENVTAGIAHDATIRLGVTAQDDGSGLKIISAEGRLAGDGLTVHWLRPVPPFEHGMAVLTIHSPQVLDIDVPTAQQGNMQLRHGHVHITGLDVKDQFMDVGLDVAGNVPELLRLLDNKRLDLLSKHPLPLNNPAGTFAGHLGVTFPLNHDLRFDQVAITTQARFRDVHLGGLAAGRDIDNGNFMLRATVDGLKASGRARVAGVPSQLAVSMDFREGPSSQIVLGAELTARATAAQLVKAGLDPGSAITAGTLAVTAHYDERRDHTARLQATADARQAGLSLIGWEKSPGPAAQASATVLIDHGKLAGIEAVHASGPGLALDARVRLVDGRPLDLVVDRLVLGATRAMGEVRFPEAAGGAILVNVSGPVLDLSAQFDDPKPGSKPEPKPNKNGQGTAFEADVRFDRVVLSHGSIVQGVAGHVVYNGRRIVALHAVTGGPEFLMADLRLDGTGRRLSLRTANGGGTLRALGVTEAVRGGALVAEARYDDTLTPPVLSGQAELTGFHVGAAVVAGKVLQALTLYGVPEAISGPGVLFDRLVLPFRWNGTRLDIVGARAFSASLGLTAQGSVNRASDRIDLQGTVVPAYILNTLPGRLPFVGRLFSPEKASGLIAMDWSLRGPLSNPTVGANPLSLLTPGILRRLFHIFDRRTG